MSRYLPESKPEAEAGMHANWKARAREHTPNAGVTAGEHVRDHWQSAQLRLVLNACPSTDVKWYLLKSIPRPMLERTSAIKRSLLKSEPGVNV